MSIECRHVTYTYNPGTSYSVDAIKDIKVCEVYVDGRQVYKA